MSAPHYHAPSLWLAGTASPYPCCACGAARHSTTADDSQRQSTTACIWQTDALFHDYTTPFRASHLTHSIGCCPGLVYRALQAVLNFVASLVGNFVACRRLQEELTKASGGGERTVCDTRLEGASHYTLSPHFVPTLCRYASFKHFVPTLCRASATKFRQSVEKV